MKKLLALYFVLNTFVFAENEMLAYDFSVNTFTDRMASNKDFEVALFGETVENVSDYWKFGFYANWPLWKLKGHFQSEYVVLDSIYTRISGEWGGAFSKKFFSISSKYKTSLEMLPKENSWLNYSFLISTSFFYGPYTIQGAYGNSREKYSFLTAGFSLKWEYYSIYFEYVKELISFWQIGHLFQKGAFRVEASYRHPLTQFYIGITFCFDSLEFSFAKKAVSTNYSASYWRILKRNLRIKENN